MKTPLRLFVWGCAVAILVIGESAKNGTSSKNGSIKQFSKTDLQYLRLKLTKDAANTEDIVVMFKGSASEKYMPNEDAPYLQGFGEVHFCSFSSDSIPLAINVLPLPGKKPAVIRLDITTSSDGVFTLNMNTINNIPPLYGIWLIDKYRNDSLDMRKNPAYSFNISQQDSSTYGAGRFALVIRQDTEYQYKLLSFTAKKNADARQVQINWTTRNEGNHIQFVIERSVPAQTFAALDSVCSAGVGTYTFTDKTPSPGENLYRLRQTDTDHSVAYSDVVQVFIPYPDHSANNINIYPNPAGNTINLATISPADTNTGFTIEFADGSGRVVKEVLSGQLPWQGNLTGLQPGTYFIRILNSKNRTLVGESRFVKL